MKKSLLSLSVILGLAASASAQVKVWEQKPDVTENGVDVLAQYLGATKTIVGDDFYWNGGTDPLKKINVSGSWLNDASSAASFVLSINTDNPVGTGGVSWSRPGAQVWSASLTPTSSTAKAGARESFYDPVSKTVIGHDTQIWDYTFDVSSANLQLQQGKTYWLLLQAVPESANATFGWKTRGDGHWGDDAVYAKNVTIGSPRAVFLPLEYWSGHPMAPASMDLAFSLEVPEPGTAALALLGLGAIAMIRRKA